MPLTLSIKESLRSSRRERCFLLKTLRAISGGGVHFSIAWGRPAVRTVAVPGRRVSLPRVRRTEEPAAAGTVFFLITAFTFDFGAGLAALGADLAEEGFFGAGCLAAGPAGFLAAGFLAAGLVTGADFLGAGFLAALTGLDFALLGIARG